MVAHMSTGKRPNVPWSSSFDAAMAARPGFEPGSRVPETRVLPLHYRALRGQFSVALGVDTGQARVGSCFTRSHPRKGS